jgi:hypothetical protein
LWRAPLELGYASLQRLGTLAFFVQLTHQMEREQPLADCSDRQHQCDLAHDVPAIAGPPAAS